MLFVNKLSIFTMALTTLAFGTAVHAADFTPAAQAVDGNRATELVGNAKISMADARAIALKAHPGKVTDEELEREKGGSGLRYSFDIKGTSGTQEVGIDAKTGTLLENKLEGPNPD